MLTNLKEEDFLVLRGSMESGRQRPAGLAVAFMLCIPLQALLLVLEKFIGGYSNYPHKDMIFQVHLVVSIIIAMFSIIYAIPAVYMRSQKIQYLLNTIVSQNLFGVSIYIIALMAISADFTIDEGFLLRFTGWSLFFGLIVFIVTCVRFYKLLQKNSYRKGSEKGEQRGRFESASYLPIVIAGGIGAVFIIQYLARNFDFQNLDTIVMSTFMIVIFYTMLFVLPEQLIIIYCKARFDSFNFEQNGRIKPVRDEKGNVIHD